MPEFIGGLTRQQAFDGLEAAKFGGSGAGPLVAVILATVDEIIPDDCVTCSIQEFPGSKIAIGATAGSIAILCTLTNTGDDKTFAISGGGTVLLTGGFWQQKIRSSVTADNIEEVICSFNVTYLAHDLDTFNGPPLSETTTTPVKTDSSYDPVTETGQDTITFSYENAAVENPTSFAIKRTDSLGNFSIVGSILFVGGQTDYEYTDFSITTPGPYTYSIIPYKLSSSSLAPESESGVDADITITTGLAFATDLESLMVMLADPSGIYTLVPGKTHDTLYERTGVDFVDIAIPEPFAKTGFVP